MDQTGLTLKKMITGMCVLVCKASRHCFRERVVFNPRKHTGASRSWPGCVRPAVKSLKTAPKVVVKLSI